MASQSFEQLRAVFDAYHKLSGKDIESVIKSEMSGNLEIGMLAISKGFIYSEHDEVLVHKLLLFNILREIYSISIIFCVMSSHVAIG